MRIGVGLSLNDSPRKSAFEAVQSAMQAVSNPCLALVFASIHLDHDEVFAGLLEAGLDPEILIGGSTYAEISPAGVTQRSVAVLLLDLPGALVRTLSAPLSDDPVLMSQSLLQALESMENDPACLQIGLLFSSLSAGRENEMLALLRNRRSDLAIFGGMACGNYDLGMKHPEFWTNYQYCGGALQNHVRLAVLQLPRHIYHAAFGSGHGWDALGPMHTITKSSNSEVYQIDGISIFEFYRQFLGRDSDDQFFELLVQRYGLALQMEDRSGPHTAVKTPVRIDRQAGSMTFYPVEELQGRKVKLIQANRKSLIAGARRAAEQCLEGLDGQRPVLVLVVSCSQRGAILHSRKDAEIDAVREVFGLEVPVIGWYSGGEIMPLLNRYDEVVNCERKLGGSGFHGTTIGLLAISSNLAPEAVVVPEKLDLKSSGNDLGELLRRSEDTLDSTEAFLSNLSRQVYQNGERLRAQSEVLHRYTPHEVWSQAGASAERGDYEIADAEFNGAFLFMDVKGFTEYSETHTPDEVVQSLNALFEPATAIIYDHGGDVDKYMGDCIFAAFRNSLQAVQAGRRILTLFQGVRARGNPFNVRIGINSGRAIRANVGGKDRREYTFIGDAVNLAQRLESQCTPGKMLISVNFPPSALDDLRFTRRTLTVKGKRDPVIAFECEPLP